MSCTSYVSCVLWHVPHMCPVSCDLSNRCPGCAGLSRVNIGRESVGHCTPAGTQQKVFFSRLLCIVISRPGQSQGLLYKQLCHSLTDSFSNPFPPTAPISGSEVMAILLKGWIWPIGGVASGKVCICSLRSRLVNIYLQYIFFDIRGRLGMPMQIHRVKLLKLFSPHPMEKRCILAVITSWQSFKATTARISLAVNCMLWKYPSQFCSIYLQWHSQRPSKICIHAYL